MIANAQRVTRPYNQSLGALWVQRSGPNTAMEYLGCHNIGDIQKPLGDITLLRCPSPSQMEQWDVTGYSRAPQDLVTTTIEGKLRRAADAIERIGICPFTLFAYKSDCGRPDDPTNFQRAFVLEQSLLTSLTRSNLRGFEGSDESMFSADVSALSELDVFQLTAARIATAEVTALFSIYVAGENQCAGPCGAASVAGDTALAGGTGGAGTANVLRTINQGADGFPALAVDPFGATYDVSAITAFKVDVNTTRYLVGRGTTVAAAAAAIAYTDDGGATWTTVLVGSTNGQFFSGPQSIFAFDMNHIWGVTTGGYIYFSSDGGVTWTTQNAGIATSGNYSAVYMASYTEGMAVAATGVVVRTVDGSTWSAVTAITATPTLNTVGFSGIYWWVGTATGKLFYTADNGTTWTERTFSGSGAGAVKYVQFMSPSFGIMVHNTAAPVGRVFYTINGGEKWLTVKNMPTNAGLNAAAIAGTDLIYAVGAAQGGTAVIVKITPAIA